MAPAFSRMFFSTFLSVAAGFVALSGSAQEQTAFTPPEDSFASENAVLDTSILFAIGAREARQELRGAFGWPTFQEGLVDGVYFRFDPDGYARFSPTPRLDTDVFEVICRPRTYTCLGRRGPIQVTLTNRGQVQLQIEGVTDADSFAVAEGIDELPLPRTILQPLDPRLETLLGSGGDLVVKRGKNEVSRTSLSGFFAVAVYLRWVAAQQDYTVMPRGWPIPNSGYTDASPGLTRVQSWQSPMPQPAVPAESQPAYNGVQSEVAEVRGELNILRELLLDRNSDTGSRKGSPLAPNETEARVAELRTMANALIAEIDRLTGQNAVGAQVPGPVSYAPPPPARGGIQAPVLSTTQPVQTANTPPIAPDTSSSSRLARQLEYLMTEIGLSPDIALMVVQQGNAGNQVGEDTPQTERHDQVIEGILEELRTQVTDLHAEAEPKPELVTEDFQLLSDYFRSVTGSQ